MMLGKLLQLFAKAAPPELDADTFVLWEPCTYSHAEVLPGYARYLLDLGFRVAVFATPKRFDEGLFARFNDPRLTLYRLSQRQIRRCFRHHGLGQARGIIITTARKISGKSDYGAEHQLFARRDPGQRLLLVEHDVKGPMDAGALTPDIITLAPVSYRQALTTMVNPHYFGEAAKITKKSGNARFITIGALRAKRRNARSLIDAVAELDRIGIRNFTITVIGRGSLRDVPVGLRQYFDTKGRVNFSELYAGMDQAHFFLALLDPDNTPHDRYITTGTSGSFQLLRGFVRPGVMAEKFALPHGFDKQNSLLYGRNEDLVHAMQKAIEMSAAEYEPMCHALQEHAGQVYQQSLSNLRRLVS